MVIVGVQGIYGGLFDDVVYTTRVRISIVYKTRLVLYVYKYILYTIRAVVP